MCFNGQQQQPQSFGQSFGASLYRPPTSKGGYGYQPRPGQRFATGGPEPNPWGAPPIGGYTPPRGTIETPPVPGQMYPGGPGGPYQAEDAGYGSWETPTPNPTIETPPGGQQQIGGGNVQVGGAEPNPAAQQTGGFTGFHRPGNFEGIPYWQTYGGQPAPYDNLHTQIRSLRDLYGMGAGRFGSNAAARYSFQGGNQQWRPDANPWGQPIAPYQYNPASAFPNMQTGGASPPPQQTTPAPTTPAPTTPAPGGGANFGATFGRLMAENPALAYMGTTTGSAGNWLQQNQNQVRDQYFGGDQERYNQWASSSSPVASNVDRTGFADRLMQYGLR